MTLHKATIDHQNFRHDLILLLDKHAGKLDSKDMLALAAHLVGQLIGVQDHRTMTREKAAEIVMLNIEQGNQELMDGLKTTRGSA